MIDRQDSKTPRSLREPNAAVDNLAHRVIGAAIEVHRHLGPGFSECVYEESLAIELGLRAIPFVRQIPLPVIYKGHRVGEGRADFLVDGALVVEIKAVQQLAGVHSAQVISYLKAGGFHLGLLLNFREAVMRRGIKRVVWSPRFSQSEYRADQVQEGRVAYCRLVVPRCDSSKSFEAVEEDLDAVA